MFVAIPTTLANGVTPFFSAALRLISTQAAAPSFSVLALAAVTVPSFAWNTGFSVDTFSNTTRLYSCTEQQPVYQVRDEISKSN